MQEDNLIIHGLWIGSSLTQLELLTLHSFVNHGHEFHLWAYNSIENQLPEKVVIQDANTIIEESQIFRRQQGDAKKNFGKGSYALFSDLFRVKLLYEKGGWWVDMDVTCLKPFDVPSPFYFRAHPILPLIGNVIKCPKGSEVMKASYIKMTEEVNSETKEWLLSNKIMNDMVEKYKLAKYIKGGLSNNDDWIEIQRILYAGKLPSSNWKFIHWMNEEWRYREIDKSAYYRNSFLGKLYHQYNIPCTSCKVPIKTNLMYRLKEIYRFGTTQIKSILK